MSSVQQPQEAVTDMRLVAIVAAAANLKSELSELEELRERVGKAYEAQRVATERGIKGGRVEYPAA